MMDGDADARCRRGRASGGDADARDGASGPHDGASGAGSGPPQRPIDTRRYRIAIGVIGLVLVVAFSISRLTAAGSGTTGVPAGHELHVFAAPLAASNLEGDPNPNPSCTPARHDPRALNVCLLVKRGPVVLGFFVPGARQCLRMVDALQALAPRFPAVQFAAVAVGAGHARAAALVRRRRWTIPVAYDRDGEVGSLYAVAACPMLELARRGGIVAQRLIGDRWQSAAALAPRVRALL